MLYGIGSVNIGTNALDANSLIGQNICFPQCTAAVSFSSETNNVKAMCYRDGVKQTVASRINSEDFTVSLTYEFLDWNTLQLLYGELAQTGGAAVPTAKSANVVGGTISEADIVAANLASVRVYNETAEVFMTLAAGAPAADEYSVAAGAITINAAQEGDTISYKYDKIYTSIESIGGGLVGDAFDELSNLNMTAVLSSALYPQGIVLVADRLERIETPSLEIADDKAVVTIQYSLIALPGRRKPFAMYQLDSGQV